VALKVGSLFVGLEANATGLLQGLSDSLKAVERFTKEAKRAAGDIAAMSTALTAIGGAALHLAADLNGPTKAAVNDLSVATKQLAVPIAQLLLPAVRALTADIRTFAQYVAGLDPHLKGQIANFAKWSVEIGGVAMIGSKVIGVISGLSGVFSALFGVLAAIGAGPILAIVAGIAIVVGAIVGLHAAFRTNFMGISDATRAFSEWFTATFSESFDAIVGNAKLWVQAVSLLLQKLVDAIAIVEAVMGEPAEGLKASSWAMKALIQGITDDLLAGKTHFISAALDLGSSFGESFTKEVQLMMNELGVSKWIDGIRGQFKKGSLAGVGGPQGDSAETRGMASIEAQNEAMRAARLANVARDVATGRSNQQDVDMVSANIQELKALEAHSIALDRAKTLQWASAEAQAKEIKAAQDAASAFGQFRSALATVGAKLAEFASSFASTLASKLGDAGSAIQNVVSAAQSGGGAAAAGAAAAELFSRTKAFNDLLETVGGAFSSLITAFEPIGTMLSQALMPILSSAFRLVTTILDGIAPILDTLSIALQAVSPILVVIAILFKGLKPLFELLGLVVKGLMYVLQGVLIVVMYIIEGVGLAVLGVVRGIEEAWNWVVEAVAKVVDFFTAGTGGDSIRAGKIDTTDTDKAISDLTSTSYAAALAQADNAAATDQAAGKTADLAKATQAANEALLNVPSGYKVALARFRATQNEGGPQGGSAIPDWLSPSSVTVHIENVNVDGADPKRFMQNLSDEIKRNGTRLYGNPFASGFP
jgi:hypothetical protein